MFGGGDAPPPAAGMGSGTHARGAASTSEHDEALRAAASRGDVDGVRDALAVGADINHVDSVRKLDARSGIWRVVSEADTSRLHLLSCSWECCCFHRSQLRTMQGHAE